VCVK